MAQDTSDRIMDAARECLLADGFANLSTRKVAERAGVPLSQIHYHFGGKQGMVLALLDYENKRLISRQREMYGASAPLWKRFEQACEFLEEDVASGYVRVLQEMIAAGWSDETVATQVLAMLEGCFDVLEQVSREAEARFGPIGPFSASDVAALVGLCFLGGEAVMLLADDRWSAKVRTALRRVTELIRHREAQGDRPGGNRPS